MNDFEYDCYLKKKIAQGEKHRVKRKRGCRLPSDNLTEAQKRKMNGEVKTMNLKKPMIWGEFKQLPRDLQETYYDNLVDTYGVGMVLIAKMFGVTEACVRQYFKKQGIVVHGVRGMKKRRDLDGWDAFLHGEEMHIRAVDEPVFEIKKCEEKLSFVEPVKTINEKVTEKAVAKPKSTLREYSFEFKSVEHWGDILKFLGNMPLPKNARVNLIVREEESED